MAEEKSKSTSDQETVRDAADAAKDFMPETEELLHKGRKRKWSERQHYDQEIKS